MNTRRFIFLLVNILFLTVNTSGQILAKIETYKCDPYPVDELAKALDLTKEAYDYRIEDGDSAKVPPSLTDVLICDIWNIITEWELKIKIKPDEINQKVILSAFEVYTTKEWSNIRGLRPWTHWNFIRSLTKKERKKLAKEIVKYIKTKGINRGRDI